MRILLRLAWPLVLILTFGGCDDDSEEAEETQAEETTETPEEPAEPAPYQPPTSEVQVSAGGESACMRLADGSARCWGRGGSGQLGTGEEAGDQPAPTPVAGLENVLQVETAGDRSCALVEGGSVHCWGGNAHGQLGDGTTERRNTPVQVLEIDNATQIALGNVHGCARLEDGTARCWGSGGNGMLGDNDDEHRPTPVQVQGLDNIEEIAAGMGHTCARLSDGTVRCWGTNTDGQCGEGAPMIQMAPRAMPGLTDVVQIVAAAQHTCARRGDGTVHCWGANDHGQLGDGTTEQRTTATQVSGITGAYDIDVGGGHGVGYSCAAIEGGGVKCWGRGLNGALGDGNAEEHDATTAVDVQGLTDVAQISLGGNNLNAHACAVRGDDSVVCWGNAYYIGTPPTYGENYLEPRAIQM